MKKLNYSFVGAIIATTLLQNPAIASTPLSIKPEQLKALETMQFEGVNGLVKYLNKELKRSDINCLSAKGTLPYMPEWVGCFTGSRPAFKTNYKNKDRRIFVC